jgi:hypothetical protein
MTTNDDDLPSEVYEAQALEALKKSDFEKALVYAVLSAAATVREAADDIELALSVFDGEEEDGGEDG